MERKRGAEGGSGSEMPPAKLSRSSAAHTSPGAVSTRIENHSSTLGSADALDSTPPAVQEYQKAQLVALVTDLRRENKYLRDKADEQSNVVSFLDGAPRTALYHMTAVREDLMLTLARLGCAGNLSPVDCPLAASLLGVEEITNKSLGDLPRQIKEATAQIVLAMEKEFKKNQVDGNTTVGISAELHDRVRRVSEQLEQYAAREQSMSVAMANIKEELEDCRNDNALRRKRIVNLENTLRSNEKSLNHSNENGVPNRQRSCHDPKSSHDRVKDHHDTVASTQSVAVPNGVGPTANRDALMLEDERKLSAARLKELHDANDENKRLAGEIESLRCDLAKRDAGVIPNEAVLATAMYQTMEATLQQLVLKENQWSKDREHLVEELTHERENGVALLEAEKKEAERAAEDFKRRISDLERHVDLLKAEKDKAAMSYEARKMESGTISTVSAALEKRIQVSGEMRKKAIERSDALQKELDSARRRIQDMEKLLLDKTKSSDSAELIAGLKKELEAEKMKSGNFIGEVESLSVMFSEVETENARLVKLLAEKEQVLSKIMGERLRARQQLTTAREENKALLNHRVVSNDRIKELTSAVGHAKKLTSDAQIAHNLAVEETRKLSLQLERRRRIADNMTLTCRTAKAESEEIRKERDELRSRCEGNAVAASERFFVEKRLQERIDDLQRQLDASRKCGTQSNGVEADHGERDEMIARLEKKLNCSVCTTERKSVVLTRCGHLFSKKCTDNLIATRNRKCPLCGKTFGLDDVMAVYY